MDFSLSTWMMIAFVLGMILSIWKLWAFMPNKQLADDDTTEESKIDLTNIILATIKNSNGNLSVDELFVKIEESEDFDSQKYWRFNKNRLNQLLNAYYIENPHTQSIEDIYKTI